MWDLGNNLGIWWLCCYCGVMCGMFVLWIGFGLVGDCGGVDVNGWYCVFEVGKLFVVLVVFLVCSLFVMCVCWMWWCILIGL